MKSLDLFSDKQKEFLSFLKTRYMLYHSSNVFFRDLHYGVMSFLELHERKHSYSESEELTTKVIASLEAQGILLNVAHQTYVLDYPDFKKPPVKTATAVKPAVPAGSRPPVPSAGKPSAPSAKAVPAAQPVKHVPEPSAGNAALENSHSDN